MRHCKAIGTFGLLVGMLFTSGYRTQEEPINIDPVPVEATAVEKAVETQTESKAIPFEVKYEFSRSVGKGRLITKQTGVKGSLKKVYQITRDEAGKIVKRELIDTIRTEPKPQILQMGTSGYTKGNRSSYARGSVRTMTATAYYPTDGSPRGLTASGIKATYGVVAVDPKVIKLGTRVYVEGYGYAIAADTGGAIKGNKIDLCMLDRRAIYNFGRRKVVVHVLSKR